MKSLEQSLALALKYPKLGLRELDRLDCEERLVDFVRIYWPEIEPAHAFVPGWHIDAICEHLEAVTAGQIVRISFNVPPGFSKSLLINVFWPAWEWGPKRLPSNRFIAASYAQSLTIRDNIRFRQIIMSERYRSTWGGVFDASPDQFSVIKVGNDKTGWKLATSVGGVGTGERGDRFIIDDGNSVKDAESEAVRASTNQWFREVVPTRMSNPEKSAIINIQQRTHEDDISGVIQTDEMDYEHLVIPMRFDTSRIYVTCTGWTDPRGLDDYGRPLEGAALSAADGALAWPERYTPKVVADLETVLGPYAAAGQLQQAPTPRGGGMFKPDWWQAWEPKQFPPMEFVIAALDGAYTEKKENCPNALTVWGVFRGQEATTISPKSSLDGSTTYRLEGDDAPKAMLMYAWEKHLDLHGRDEVIPEGLTEAQWRSPEYLADRQASWGVVEWVTHTCRQWKVDVLLIEAAANGLDVSNEMRRLYSREGFHVILIPARGDKISRAASVQPLFANHRVYAPVERAWAIAVIDQVSSFPKGSRKDLVDSAVHALRYLRENGFVMRTDEVRAEHEDSLQYRKSQPRKLYDV